MNKWIPMYICKDMSTGVHGLSWYEFRITPLHKDILCVRTRQEADEYTSTCIKVRVQKYLSTVQV
jgi:hypothetical protein